MTFVASIFQRGDLALRKMFKAASNAAPHRAAQCSEQMATDLVRIVRENASGRPGPEVVTGAYRSSIMKRERKQSRLFSTVTVGTDSPEAWRLEYGFVGIDSLGRHYHQPAFPHWRPGIRSLQVSKKKYAAILREALPK